MRAVTSFDAWQLCALGRHMTSSTASHSGQRPTGIEWSNTIRHWWRYERDEQAMIHRSSGERVAFRGQVSGREFIEGGAATPSTIANLPDTNLWGLFEYTHGAEKYPLLVEVRRVTYPNPRPDRYAAPPYRGISEPFLDLTVWRIDHIRSAALWKSQRVAGLSVASDAPPYVLWYKAERAMADAALLWPPQFPVLPVADEVAINGGWLGGTWRSDYYRRLRPEELWRTVAPSVIGPSVGTRQFGLPLSQYSPDPPFSESPVWTDSRGPATTLHGEPLTSTESILWNESEQARIAHTTGDLSNALGRRFGLTMVCGDFFATLLFGSSTDVNAASARDGNPNRPAPSWIVAMYGYCAMGVRTAPGRAALFKSIPVVWTDSITDDGKFGFDASASEVGHPLLSYRLWQWLHTSLVNALPFSSGLGLEGLERGPTQGDLGRICIAGGFIGGIQGLVTEIRLHLRLASDRRDTDWTNFFD